MLVSMTLIEDDSGSEKASIQRCMVSATKQAMRPFLRDLDRDFANVYMPCPPCFYLDLPFSAPGMICQEPDSPLVANGQVTSWRRSLASLEGDVSCDADYMYVGSNPMVQCVATNKWQPADGHCARRIWTSGLVNA